MEKKEKIFIYTDGGARGNPGPAGIGVVMEFPKGFKKIYNAHIGTATNNVAEYSAVIFALSKARALIKTPKDSVVEIRSDSELLVKQMKGEYRVKNEGLRPLYEKAKSLTEEYGKVYFVHIPRGKNKESDDLVNRALDGDLV
jgi:ribonuclease HI